MSAIQPCALLLLVGPDWLIKTVSANAAMLGDHRPAELVAQPLAELVGSKAIHLLRNRLAWLSSDESEVRDYGIELGGVTLDIRAFRDEHDHLIEAELAVEPRLPDGIGMVRSMTDRLSGNEPGALAEQAMRQLAALTGFDRVTLCGRDGRVVATNKGNAGDPHGECFELERLVADRDSEPVPLVGDDLSLLLGRAAFASPDLGRCEQLAGQGISATMALPLRIDGELVGALHASHGSPRRIGAERRSVVHLFTERLVARMARHGWTP